MISSKWYNLVAHITTLKVSTLCILIHARFKLKLINTHHVGTQNDVANNKYTWNYILFARVCVYVSSCVRSVPYISSWNCRLDLFAMQMSKMKKPVGQVKVYNLLNRFKLPGQDRQKSTTPFWARYVVVLEGEWTWTREYIYIQDTLYTGRYRCGNMHPISFDIKECNNFFPPPSHTAFSRNKKLTIKGSKILLYQKTLLLPPPPLFVF